jgi:chemotaxis methyl-accepting protein methylase
MRITNFTAPNYKPQNIPSFAANRRLVFHHTAQNSPILDYRNVSDFFREDLNWDKFTDMLIKKYENVDKVNIYNFACSSGEEPFSLAMMLIRKLGEKKAQKFFPIVASDIDKDILKNPMQGIIKPSVEDTIALKKVLGGDFSKFIEIDNKFEFDQVLNMNVCTGKIKPLLQDKVLFSQADAKANIVNVVPSNSVVLCRNFSSYLCPSDFFKFIGNLRAKLKDNSMCVIGDADYEMRMELETPKFKDNNVPYCFEQIVPQNRGFLKNRSVS